MTPAARPAAPLSLIVTDAPRDGGRAYDDTLEPAGVPIWRLESPGMIRGFIDTAAGRMIEIIEDELRRRFA